MKYASVVFRLMKYANVVSHLLKYASVVFAYRSTPAWCSA